MKTYISRSVLAALLLYPLAGSIARATDTLWNLTFKDLKPGQAVAEVPFSAPCSGPQKVSVDATNTLAGAASVGTLSPALVYTKGNNSHYLPSMTLKAASPFTSGVITVSFDILFDKVTPTADRPIETLMAFPFINDDGGSTYIPVIACSGPGNLVLGGAGLAKSKTPATFPTNAVAHLKAVLDLNQHTFQMFLNDAPAGDPEHDDKKFASFLGLTIRDGTALGGNNGATFTAGIGNLVITHS